MSSKRHGLVQHDGHGLAKQGANAVATRGDATAVVERSDYYCCRSKERAVPQAIENTAVTCYYMHDAVRSQKRHGILHLYF